MCLLAVRLGDLSTAAEAKWKWMRNEISDRQEEQSSSIPHQRRPVWSARGKIRINWSGTKEQRESFRSIASGTRTRRPKGFAWFGGLYTFHDSLSLSVLTSVCLFARQ